MKALTRRTALGLLAAGVAMPAHATRARLIDSGWRTFGQAGDPDHGAWGQILAAGLRLGRDGVARFDYAGASKPAVDAYIAAMQQVDPTALTSPAAFAYWVNLYNAVTIQTVLAAYPVRSIREIGGNPLARGPWRAKLVTVRGQRLSLDDIEHGILRPIWQDPRIHYGVNCASIGCPDLARQPYTSGNLATMLEAGARNFVNHPRGVQVRNGRLHVSSIYHWFKADFGGTDSGVIAHLKRYANAQLSGNLDTVTGISSHSYDWDLNRA